jgi:hypothetical protein
LDLLHSNDAKTEIKLSLSKPSKIYEDFVLTYGMADAELPFAVFGRTDAGCSAMVSFVPKFSKLSAENCYSASLKGEDCDTDETTRG